jgi:hypothetical protein
MLQISILGYLVGATFLNMAYAELIYTLIALSVGLELAAQAEAGAAAVPVPALQPVQEIPWWRRPPEKRLARPAARGGI